MSDEAAVHWTVKRISPLSTAAFCLVLHAELFLLQFVLVKMLEAEFRGLYGLALKTFLLTSVAAFFGGLLFALLYNLFAGMFGGITISLAPGRIGRQRLSELPE
jgi:hypothetical protein